jgi:hypothetical protein
MAQGAALQNGTVNGMVNGMVNGTPNKDGERGTSWEMIGLGLEEPLPPPDVMEDLYVQCDYSITQLTRQQIPDLLYKNPHLDTNHPPATVHGSAQSRPAHAAARGAAI